MDNRPISFLGSGADGLTVVRGLVRQLPYEGTVYIGDSARALYGPRPVEQIHEYAWKLVDFLLIQSVKTIVSACNTTTAVAWEEVRKKLDIPVLEVVLPGSSVAIKSIRNEKIGVIGTPMAIKSDIYHQKVKLLAPQMNVTSLSCPKSAPLVESNEMTSGVAKKVVYETLVPLVDKVDTLALGYTHYPLFHPIIQNIMGPDVKLIDSGAKCIYDISILLNYFEINRSRTQDDVTHAFYTTASSQSFKGIAMNWSTKGIDVRHVDLKKLDRQK